MFALSIDPHLFRANILRRGSIRAHPELMPNPLS